MSQGVSAAETLRSEWRGHSVSRTCIRKEYEDCSNRVKEAKKEMRKIERAIPNKELLVKYRNLMIRNKEDEDAMEDKETDIEIHEKELQDSKSSWKKRRRKGKPARVLRYNKPIVQSIQQGHSGGHHVQQGRVLGIELVVQSRLMVISVVFQRRVLF